MPCVSRRELAGSRRRGWAAGSYPAARSLWVKLPAKVRWGSGGSCAAGPGVFGMNWIGRVYGFAAERKTRSSPFCCLAMVGRACRGMHPMQRHGERRTMVKCEPHIHAHAASRFTKRRRSSAHYIRAHSKAWRACSSNDMRAWEGNWLTLAFYIRPSHTFASTASSLPSSAIAGIYRRSRSPMDQCAPLLGCPIFDLPAFHHTQATYMYICTCSTALTRPGCRAISSQRRWVARTVLAMISARQERLQELGAQTVLGPTSPRARHVQHVLAGY